MEAKTKIETTSTLWGITDEGLVLETCNRVHHISKGILFEISEDGDDGTFPRVCDYMRYANSLEREGTSYYLNRLTRKKNKYVVEIEGVKIIREASYETKAIIEFPEPIEVIVAVIGDEPVIKKIKSFEGEFIHDWFWRNDGRQDKIANGFEIWFNIEKFLS